LSTTMKSFPTPDILVKGMVRIETSGRAGKDRNDAAAYGRSLIS
jgi:hypothetical protein